MKISLPCLFLLCITAGAVCEGMKETKTSQVDEFIKQSTDLNVLTPHNIQSDQRVPKQNPSKTNRKKCYVELLRTEKKLKRRLVNVAKRREQLNEKIEKEQRFLVQLQTKQKRPIKPTPKLRKLEKWDRKQIKLQNELKEKIENVQKRFCSDFDATTKRTVTLETPTSTALSVKVKNTTELAASASVPPTPTRTTVELTEVKPTRKHPSRKPSRAEKVRGRKSKTVRPKPWLTSLPTSVGATTPHYVSSTTVPSSESNKMKTPTTEAKLGPYTTPWKTAFDTTTTTVEVPKTEIGIETTTDSKMKTNMPWKSVFSITPTTVHMKSIGHTTTRKATLWSPSATLDPSDFTVYPHLTTESSSTSTKMTTTGPTTNTISTTNHPYRTITPSSHQASRSEPLDITTYTLPSAPTLSSSSATQKTFKLDKETRNPVTELPVTRQHRGKVNNERGRSLSSIVDAYNKSEKEAIVFYVSVAVSVVIVVILVISIAIYFFIFHGKCVKMKDEESSVDSKYMEE